MPPRRKKTETPPATVLLFTLEHAQSKTDPQIEEGNQIIGLAIGSQQEFDMAWRTDRLETSWS